MKSLSLNRSERYIKCGWDAISGVWGPRDLRGAELFVKHQGSIPAFDDDIMSYLCSTLSCAK